MRIASWNVNSIKARLEHVLAYCKADKTDVLLLQELKTTDDNFPRLSFEDIGWQLATHGQKTYNGVAILAKRPIQVTQVGLAGDDSDEQARYIEAEIEGIRIASIYLPNGNPCPGPKYDYKLAWMDRLFSRAKHLFNLEIPVVLAGDFNVIPHSIDCYDPLSWQEDALFREETKSKFYAICNIGYLDALRQIHPKGAYYTF
ncbi:MAG: exodeoxyribonuclease III, partial [Alphaproteobacteria bacterium]